MFFYIFEKKREFSPSFRIQSFFFLSSGTHKIVGPGRLFEHKPRQCINEAITTRNGIAKGVRIIVNDDGKPCPALVADGKETN
jgi:hypothetical protein